MDKKLCRDCMSCQGRGSMLAGCIRSKSRMNPVTGEKLFNTCLEERSRGWFYALLSGRCGKAGRYFTKRSSNPPRINEQGGVDNV